MPWVIHHAAHLAIQVPTPPSHAGTVTTEQLLPTVRTLDLNVTFEYSTLTTLQIRSFVDDNYEALLRSNSNNAYHLYIVERPSAKTWSLQITHHRTLILYTAPGMAKVNSLVAELISTIYAHEFVSLTGAVVKMDGHQATTKHSSGYNVYLSLLNGNSQNTSYSWDIDQAVQEYLKPFVDQMATVSRMSVYTQIKEYASLKTSPVYNVKQKRFEITPDLAPFVISGDWNLASSMAKQHELNFILYTPALSISPLVIVDNNGIYREENGILVPQWGGLQVHNNNAKSNHLSVESLKPYMEIFLHQLRELMGINEVWPLSDASRYIESKYKIKVATTPASSGIDAWEMDKLLRYRIAENVVSTCHTISALESLIQKMQAMPVGEHIARQVALSVSHLSLATEALKAGNLTTAMHHSQCAIKYAEDSFFDPTMISMLYFPDEHIYAVYAPMLLPAAVPVLQSIVRLFKSSRQRKLQ